MAMPVEENLSVVLSREELVFLLYVLKANFIPGLDPDPLGELPKEYKNFGLAYAERSLRARGLIDLDDTGNPVVREAIILLVGTCAYPEMMISLHHFPSSAAPTRTFWHAQSGVIVSHTRPDAPLHEFSFVKDRLFLGDQILAACQLKTDARADFKEIRTTNKTLKAVRQMAGNDLGAAIKTLAGGSASLESATELCHILAGEHSVSALHLATKNQEKTPVQETFSVLSGQNSTWMMTGQDGDDVLLSVINAQDLKDRFARWISLSGNWPEVAELG